MESWVVCGETLQMYVTGRCGVGCHFCGSKGLEMPDMSLETFKKTVQVAKTIGVRRVEPFANDVSQHPYILEMVRILNSSGLGYALLTVGANPFNPHVERNFILLLDEIDRVKGGVVFSVDFTEETAQRIISAGVSSPQFARAYKASIFWNLIRAGLLQIPVRTNSVITADNIQEVPEIMRRVADMGFAASCCFVQMVQPKFQAVADRNLFSGLERDFRNWLWGTGFLNGFEIDRVVSKIQRMMTEDVLKDRKVFNTFRTFDTLEGVIPISRLIKLQGKIMYLKDEYGKLILPSEEYISTLGDLPIGCLGLLKQGKMSSLKVGPNGELFSCCDLHDPVASMTTINNFSAQEAHLEFLEHGLRNNPYVLFCAWANPCSFSVNWVKYDTKKSM